MKSNDNVTRSAEEVEEWVHDEWLWIEALGDYIKLITTSDNIIILSSLKSFEKELPKGKFMRIHKSFIVNLDRIETYNNKCVFIDSGEIPISRNKKTELDAVLNLKHN